MASFIYQQNRSKPISEIQTLIHDALFAISWDQDRGYYFMEDMDGTEIVNRNNPDLEGLNILNLQDSNGTYMVREIIAVARSEKGEGFCSYYWNKPDHPGVLVPKISYVKYFQPLNLVIGTGKYLRDEEEVIKKKLLAHFKELNSNSSLALRLGTWQNLNLIESPETPSLINNKLISTARSGGSFIYDNQAATENLPASNKIYYSQAVNEWQWYVSATIDLLEIEKTILANQQTLREATKKKIIQIGLTLLFLLLSAYIIARLLSIRIKKNITLFNNFFSAATLESTKIDLNQTSFIEFDNLAVSANTMIEDRLTAEQSFKESEARFFRVLENAHIPMPISNNDGQTEFLNHQFIKTFGYTLEDVPDIEELGLTVKLELEKE